MHALDRSYGHFNHHDLVHTHTHTHKQTHTHTHTHTRTHTHTHTHTLTRVCVIPCVCHQVLDDATGAPVEGSVATVTYGASGTHVTRKTTSSNGAFAFGGWVGKSSKSQHTITVVKDGYDTVTVQVHVVARARTPIKVRMHKQSE
jgi:hypothetical protein